MINPFQAGKVVFLGVFLGAIPTAVGAHAVGSCLGGCSAVVGRLSRHFTKGMATGEFSAPYPLQAVEIAPFLSLSPLYHTVASQLLHAWADAAWAVGTGLGTRCLHRAVAHTGVLHICTCLGAQGMELNARISTGFTEE